MGVESVQNPKRTANDTASPSRPYARWDYHDPHKYVALPGQHLVVQPTHDLSDRFPSARVVCDLETIERRSEGSA